MQRGLTLLTKSTFSSVSSVSIDNVFSNDYYQYRIIGNIVGSTNTYSGLKLRSGGTTINNTYIWQLLAAGSSSYSAVRNTNDIMAVGYIRSTGAVISICELLNPYQNTYKSISTTWPYDDLFNAGIAFNAQAFSTNFTTSCDGVYIYPLSGTMTGTISIYGFDKS